ncbi:MAG: hypothetical protein EBR67_00810 [Proteobacteria bacterium]|nr:hypothetical protein [Pseudomonadota bacterium]
MNEDRGSAYYVNDNGIQIHNAWGLAEFQKKYPIFKDQTILDLIDFIGDRPIGCLAGSEYIDLTKEINGRFESVFKDISDIRSAIDWSKIPHDWAEKEVSIWYGSWVLKSFFIPTAALHKGKSYGL